MADFSRCEGEGCKKKELCLRFTTPPRAKWQSWVLQKVMVPDLDNCRFFKPSETQDETSASNAPIQ